LNSCSKITCIDLIPVDVSCRIWRRVKFHRDDDDEAVDEDDDGGASEVETLPAPGALLGSNTEDSTSAVIATSVSGDIPANEFTMPSIGNRAL
jgi:hypothetical protein